MLIRFPGPEILGTVPPEHFKELHRILPEDERIIEHPYDSHGEPHKKLTPHDEELCLAVAAMVVGMHIDPGHQRPYLRDVTRVWVNTLTIPPGESQRPRGFHADAGPVVSMSDFSTLCLVDQSEPRQTTWWRPSRTKRRIIDAINSGEATPSDFGLEIIQSPSRSALRMNRAQIHGSPINETGVPLARAWVGLRLAVNTDA